MKTIISKLVNRYTAGVYLAILNGAAFAGSMGGMSGSAMPAVASSNAGWIEAGLIGIVTVIGIAAVSVSGDDDDDVIAAPVY